MSYKISVIIPVYNAEDYIKQCLDSLVSQSLGIENIEVIIVNDATPDNSMDIVNEFASKYSSFKVINNEKNLGQGESRNIALKHVSCDYVTYLDSDDFISQNSLKDGLNKIIESGADLLIYNWETYRDDGEIEPVSIHQQSVDENKLINGIDDAPNLIFSTAPWNKIYHKSLFKFLKFSNGAYEDNIVAVLSLFNAKKIYLSKDATYYYRKNLSSTTKKVTLKNPLGLVKSIKELFDLKYRYPEYLKYIKYLNIKFINDVLFWIHEYDWHVVDELKIVDNLKEAIIPIEKSYLDKFESNYPHIPLYKEYILDLFNQDSKTFLANFRYFTKLMDVNAQATLYIDTGDDFNENQKISIDYQPSASNRLTFDVSGYDSIERLRFDPLEGYFIKSKVDNELVYYADSITTDGEGFDVFSKLDPYYLLKSPDDNKITIDFEIEKLNSSEMAELLNYVDKDLVNCEASLYVDTGNGFSESEKIAIKYLPQDINSLVFDLSSFDNIKRLRFDPLEGQFIKSKISVAFEDANCDNLLDDEFQVFYNLDPFYLLAKTDDDKIKIDFNLEFITKNELNTIIMEKNNKINELSSKNKRFHF